MGYLAAKSVVKQPAFIARAPRGFANRRAANYFLDEIAFLVDVNLCFVRRAEKIVIVAHHFLISTDQHESHIVGFVRLELVQLEDLLYVVQVDEFVDHAIGIAGDVAKRREFRGRLIQFLNRYNREQLIEGPVIRQRLEYGKVGQVLCAQQESEFAELFGDVFGLLRVTVGVLD